MTTNPTALMEKLKPCPFCGGAAADLRDSRFTKWLGCGKCGISFSYADKKKGIKAWNTRHPDPSLLAALSMQREALEKIAKMPDLPNPDRDADWKNCMKWASHYATEALTATLNLTGDDDGK